ncbi:hypothetical protein AMS68_003857 [Peltaster fructicola]|uniref:Uncharacterized protein n=1 Tax=Peltaster fructicola TaxID=286661 RepID=A0A6H0XV67_9PEZI|nr:hypothetical protein AMS68_003857 [Peltaster fructicola]
MSTFLVTGTSRGIGLELVRQLASSSEAKTVVAVTRDNKSTALQTIIDESKGRVVNVIIPDIIDEKTVQSAVPEIEKALSGAPLDVLINNAGAAAYDADGVKSTTVEDLTNIFRINVGSVQAVTSSLLPLLEKGKTRKVINISTTLGSITHSKVYDWAPATSYKTSKAALNMLTKIYANTYESQGFTFLLITPGWLKTDLGSQNADLPVEVGVKSVLDIIHGSTTADNGKFRNIRVAGWENAKPNWYDGAEVPW